MSRPIKPVSNQVVRVGTTAPKAGGWLSSGPVQIQDARERLGYSQAAQTSSLYESPESHYSFYRQYRSLFPEQYWSLYKSSPDIRICVDSIVRRIATWDWFLKPVADPRDAEEYRRLTAAAEKAADFLRVPNSDGKTWQEVMTATITDLLVYDHGVLEMVENRQGEFTELVSWLGSEWFEVVDTHGRLIRYDQTPENSNEPPVEVPPERICAFKLFNNNRSTNGLPIIESCITECLTVMLSSEHAMLALDADEIPPGLLVLGGVAGAAAERARADLQQMRGKDHRIRVVTSPEPSGIQAEWVEMRRTPRELELMEVVETMRKVIWRVFGVSPVELGETGDTPRASAQVQMDVSTSHLITPILEIIQARVNAQILPRLLDEADVGKVVFSFERGQMMSADDKLKTAQRSELLLKRGVLTVNEVRQELGYLPIEGGDIATVETNMGPIPLKAVSDGFAPAMLLPGTQYADLDDQYPATYRALGDLSKAVQDNLREKAREHNDSVRAEWRRTTAGTLAKVFDRGVGAYYGNPESVRPTVTSAEQWAYGRVNSFLYALKNDKFRRGEHDTDLLPKQHPLSSRKAYRDVPSGLPSFDMAPLQTPWGWDDDQRERLLGEPADWKQYAKAHLWNDGSGDERFGAYKFPIARRVYADDEEPRIVFRGVASVVGALKEDGKHESLDGVSVDEQKQIYRHVKSLYDMFGQEAPVIERLEDERAVGDVDPTNFPAAGDDKDVSLANSQWDIFDPKYAEDLKRNYPSIWRKGGNIRGNDQYRKLRPIIMRGGSMKPKNRTEEGAIRLREAWVARHEGDFRLPGVIAQIKWFAISDRGEKYMKDLVDEAKAKVDADRHAHGHVCTHDHDHDDDFMLEMRSMHQLTRLSEIHRAAAITDIPATWQSGSVFDGVRTIDLESLAADIAAYTNSVAQLYTDAATEIEANIRAALAAAGAAGLLAALQRIHAANDATLDALAARWASMSEPYYRDAALAALASANDLSTGVLMDRLSASAYADEYQATAMSYLTDERGLVGTLKSQLRQQLDAAVSADDGADRAAIIAASLLIAAAIFRKNAHRVSNWTGKLTGLSNQIMVRALMGNGNVGTNGQREVWFYEWVTAGGESCETCRNEGDRGILPLETLSVMPGEDTECGAKCRCVLVLWTEAEVRSGAAKPFSILRNS